MAKIATLNIGASQLVLAEYQVKGTAGPVLSSYASASIAGLDLEAEGSVEAILVPALREAAATAGIKPGNLYLALSGQMVFPRFSKFPCAPGDKLDEFVRYEVEQEVPFPIDEIIYDYQYLGPTSEGESAAMIVASKTEQVSKVTDAVASCGFNPVVVDAGPMAVLNALRSSYPGSSDATVVLDIGAKTTSLILAENEKIYLRSIPVAGNAITKEIAQSFGCTLEEAEALKRERGYVSLGGVTEDEDEVADRISKIVRATLTRLHAEILRSINFYRSQQGGAAPKRLFIAGGSAVLPQIDDFFRETLKIDVEFLNPFGGITFGPKVDVTALETDAFTLAESAGLALRAASRAPISINLLPPELVEKARTVKRMPFIAAGAVALLAAMGVYIAGECRMTSVAQAEIEVVGARNGTLRSFRDKLNAAEKKANAELAKSDVFQQLMASRFTALSSIASVRTALLPGMWVTAWETAQKKQNDDEDAPRLTRITIRGWRDVLSDLETEHSKRNEGKKMTAEEIVAGALKTRRTVIPETVKIVSQKDVNSKGVLSEFVIELAFAKPASVDPNAKKAKAKKKRGGRR